MASLPCLLFACWLLSLSLLPLGVTSFTGSVAARCRTHMSDHSKTSTKKASLKSRLHILGGLAGGVAALALPFAAVADPPLEKFAAGQICIQRNLNGSCNKFATEDVTEEVRKVAKSASPEEPESELVELLKKRTLDNKSRNDEEIATKTFMNGQAGEFGPFSRYVPVKHKGTGKYELLDKTQLEDMKKAGLIVTERGADFFVDIK